MTSLHRRLVIFLTLFVFATVQLPTVAVAEPTPSSMGTTNADTRKADLQTIDRSLADAKVQDALAQAGTSPEQLRLLLPRMSNHDVHQLASNMDQVKTGGVIVEVLVIVLLVLLILYLYKRI